MGASGKDDHGTDPQCPTPGQGQAPRIGFVLSSSRAAPMPSTRIAALNLFEPLRQAGFEPVVLHEPEAPCQEPRLDLDAQALRARGVRCVVFQKTFGPDAIRLAHSLRQSGIASLFLVCDVVEPEMAAATDASIVVTDFLRSLYPTALRGRIHVVHDGIERGNLRRESPRPHQGSWADPLRAVLITSSCLRRLPHIVRVPPWLKVHVVGRYDERLSSDAGLSGILRLLARGAENEGSVGERLAFALSPRIRRLPWTWQGAYEELLAADLALVPSEIDNWVAPPRFPVPTWLVKSENRLTMAMSAALPVIATPIPAYAAVIDQGRNGYLAQDRGEWLSALQRLRDPEHRRAIGEAARMAVCDRFSQARQAALFIDVLRSVLSRSVTDVADRQRAGAETRAEAGTPAPAAHPLQPPPATDTRGRSGSGAALPRPNRHR